MKLTNRLAAAVGVLICILVFLCDIFCSSPKPPEQADASPYLNHNDSVKYVGMDQCRSCHNDIYKTFIETGMGQSFAPASRQKSAADFSRHHIVHDRYSDLSYFPYFKKDTMYIMEFRLQGKDTVHKRIEKVDYIIGSGQHTNSHMMNVNGFLYQLPLTWYAQQKKWDLPPGYEGGHNVRFNRAIGFECMSCHNAMPAYVEHSLNKFTKVPGGIDCERCHGPGEAHVKERLTGSRVDTAHSIDYTIVNPRKLPWERQIDVCQRCHLQGNVVLKPGKTFADFRPGMVLHDFMDIYMPKYRGREDEFIMASHAQRLQKSKCFIEAASEGVKGTKAAGLTCISCHNPHLSVKVTGKEVFNNACARCHDMKSDCKESMAVRMKNGDNCNACHMPKSGTLDIPHVTVTDHWIHVPARNKDKNELKEFAGIYCINNPASDQQARCKAYISYHEKFEASKNVLDSAVVNLGSVSGDLAEFRDMRIHLLYLRGEYNNVVRMANTFKDEEVSNPWMCYRIGQAFQNLGAPHVAEKWYRKAIGIAPENIDFLNKLGTVLVEQDKVDEGIAVLESSLKKNPKQSVALTNLGFAFVKKGKMTAAAAAYDHALALDPDFEQALLNKAALLNYGGEKKKARVILQGILRRNPANEQVKSLLQSLH